MVNFSTWGFSIYKTSHWICLRILSTALRRSTALKVLDYAYWLNYYNLVSFDCFPVFLHAIVSVIKHSLTKVFHGQKAGRGHGEVKTIGSCSISMRHMQVPTQQEKENSFTDGKRNLWGLYNKWRVHGFSLTELLPGKKRRPFLLVTAIVTGCESSTF